MKTKYLKGKDGESIRVNLPKTEMRLACCDCGMVHRIQFHRIKKDIWDFAFFADRRATAQLRRHNYGNLKLEKIN